MDQQEVIRRYEARASDLKLSIAELCKEAGIHPTTFSRWKASEKNTRPGGMTFTSMAAIERALAAREQARAA